MLTASVVTSKHGGRGSIGYMSEDSITVEELAERADEYLHETSLTPEEYEALKHSVAELAPIFSTDWAYFILGSYGQSEIRRLQLVKDRLNRRLDAYAFLIFDFSPTTPTSSSVSRSTLGEGSSSSRGTSPLSNRTSRRRTSSTASMQPSMQRRSTRTSTSTTRTAGCRPRSSRCSTRSVGSVSGPPRTTLSTVQKTFRESRA